MQVPEKAWYDSRLCFGESAIHGKGMFATAAIAAGEVVGVVGGEMLDGAEFRRRTAGLPKYNAIQIDDDLHLLGVVGDVERARINHSCDSNLWLTDEVTLAARRAIAAGEEITIDYALFTTTEDWVLESECRCASLVCRRHVTGLDWRQPEVQARYSGHFSPFINRRIASLESDARPVPQ